MSAEISASRLKNYLADNLARIQERIQNASRGSAGFEQPVKLIAVSKKQPVSKILTLAELGHLDFGENYVQEALTKIKEPGLADVNWHFIGGLQTNKARQVAGTFSMVHSVDSSRLAQALHKKAESLGIVQPVLIQVNLAGEVQKSGIDPDRLQLLARKIAGMKNLNLQGLMLMPPFADDPEHSRPYFQQLRRIKNRLEKDLGLALPHLSMGMSMDFEVAVQEGATMVRVGSKLFGPRMNCA
ncbi:MAG: YggS family pyridoxal phosphate-dependent enzyme [Desulfonatronovibrionaceae bacterium]